MSENAQHSIEVTNTQTQETVVAAGLLSQLFSLLFKGIDNLLGSTAKYENDMGVLKQVNEFKVLAEDDKEYTLKVKLAPVKDKDETFYIEVECDAPNFNGDEINKKTAKINNENFQEFNDLVNKLIKDNHLRVIKGDDEEGEESEEAKEDKYTISCYDADEYDDWMAGTQNEPQIINVKVIETTDPENDNKINLKMKASDGRNLKYDGQPINESAYAQEIDPNEVDDRIDDILNENKLLPIQDADTPESTDENDIQESKHIDVSLSCIKSSKEVQLNAIYANYSLADAMNSLEQLADNDEFTATLTEEPQCFRITDEGDDFDIAVIEQVDLSRMEPDVNDAIANLAVMLDAYYVNMDEQQQKVADELTASLKRAQTYFKSPNLMDEL